MTFPRTAGKSPSLAAAPQQNISEQRTETFLPPAAFDCRPKLGWSTLFHYCSQDRDEPLKAFQARRYANRLPWRPGEAVCTVKSLYLPSTATRPLSQPPPLPCYFIFNLLMPDLTPTGHARASVGFPEERTRCSHNSGR